MRYIRFLKNPRIVTDKGTAKSHVYCLITITSDLGDSFFPYDVELAAELISPKHDFHTDEVCVWRTLKWTAGMRTLAITLPLKKSYASGPLCVRVGVEPQSSHDSYPELSQADSQGIVSAWSAEFNTATGDKEAVKLVQRRFNIAQKTISVWEETGESIARHLWDAGISFSHHLSSLLLPTSTSNSPNSNSLAHALSLPTHRPLTHLEQGTGCGNVGLTHGTHHPQSSITLTDLPEARSIVEKNIASSVLATGSTASFAELDWDAALPLQLTQGGGGIDLVVAADCTYNSDSSPALVTTLHRLATISPNVTIAIAMKMRHSSERVFFTLMADAGFRETADLAYELPGDVRVGEETVHVHVYRVGL